MMDLVKTVKNRLSISKAMATMALLLAFMCLLMPLSAMAAITANPQSANYPEYAVAFYECDADDEGAEYHWYIVFNGTTYDFDDTDSITKAEWIHYVDDGFGAAPNGKSIHFDGIHKDLDGAVVYCIVKAGDKEYKSGEAIIQVTDAGSLMPPVVKVPASVEVAAGEPAKLSCTVDEADGVNYEFQWYKSSNGTLPDIKAILEEGAAKAEMTMTEDAPGTYYYYCMVTAAKGGASAVTYSGRLTVNVSEPASEEPTETPDAATEEPVETAAETEEPSETSGGPETAAPSETATEKPSSSASGGINIMSLLIILVSVLGILVCIAVVIVIVILLFKKKK